MSAPRVGARGAHPEEAFRGLFAMHYGAVYAYAARRIGRDEAADVAAEVFTVAWRKIRSVPEEPLPWLYGVARRVVANHLRGALRRARLGERMAAQPRLRREGHASDLEEAMASLSDADREVLMLAAWEGLGPAELGRVLGCSTNAATVRLHRARARLEAAWDADGGDR